MMRSCFVLDSVKFALCSCLWCQEAFCAVLCFPSFFLTPGCFLYQAALHLCARVYMWVCL